MRCWFNGVYGVARYNNIMMKKSDEQGVGLIMEGYFRASERQVREQEQKKVIKIAQIYEKQGWQRRLLHQMYAIFKKLLKRENFAPLCKRLLHIWDELLQNQVRRNSSSGFRTALSEIIVESYTFIFPLILEYRFHDLILDFKLYRMLWAKYISDDAFYHLRTEIAKLIRNFDLNKGLTAEHVDLIRKRFAKKGATQEEIQNYMGVTQLDRRTDPSPSAERRIERERDSSEDESEALRKRIKTDGPQHFARQNYDGYSPDQYMYPGPTNAYPQPQPYQPPQNSYGGRPPLPQATLPPAYPPNPSKNMYPPYSRPYGNNFNPPPPLPPQHSGHYPMPSGVPPAPQGFYAEPKNAHYGYQDYSTGYPPTYPPQQAYNTPASNYPPTPQPAYLPIPTYPNAPQRPPAPKMPPADFPINSRELKRQSPEFTPNMSRSPLQGQPQYYPQVYEAPSTLKGASQQAQGDRGKYKALLGNLRKGLSECKECGVHFLSRENLEQHKRDHFQQAQRRFQAKESQQLGSSLGIQRQKARTRESYDMMCTPSQWISAGSSSEGEAAYQVSIKRLPPMERTIPVFYCYFCNEDLEVNWCTQLQEWTLNNGVKVREADRGLCVAHFDCYECFRNEDPAFHPAPASQLAN